MVRKVDRSDSYVQEIVDGKNSTGEAESYEVILEKEKRFTPEKERWG